MKRSRLLSHITLRLLVFPWVKRAQGATSTASPSTTATSVGGGYTVTLDTTAASSATSAVGTIAGYSTAASTTSTSAAQALTGGQATTHASTSAFTITTSTKSGSSSGAQISSAAGLGIVSFNATEALTTLFVPPSSCLNAPWTVTASTQGVISCTRSLSNPALCFPDGWTSLRANGGIYSPGICPSGYYPDRRWTASDDDATTSVCCPISMSFLPAASSCVEVFSTPTSVLGSIHGYVFVTDVFTGFAPTIAVAWATRDLSDFPLSSANPLLITGLPASVSSATATATSTSTATATSPSIPFQQHASTSGPSAGTRAGIGFACAVAGLVLLGIGSWHLWRHRKTTMQQDMDSSLIEQTAEMSEKNPERRRLELDGDNAVTELDPTGMKAELSGDGPYEMATDWRGYEVQNTSR